jgi:hypothetical protein
MKGQDMLVYGSNVFLVAMQLLRGIGEEHPGLESEFQILHDKVLITSKRQLF